MKDSNDNQDEQTTGNIDDISSGFESEGENTKTDEKPEQHQQKRSKSKSDEIKANFQSVFGHGIGKLSLIFAIGVVLVAAALGYRGLTNNAPPEAGDKYGKMDVPTAPSVKADVSEVSEKEAERRAERAAHEAQEAAKKGDSYQPGFDTNIIATPQNTLPSTTVDFVPVGATPQNKTPVQVSVPAGRSTASGNGSSSQTAQQVAQAEQQAKQKLEQELKKAEEDRNKYVEMIRGKVLEQAEALLGKGGQSPLNAAGTYSSVSYYTQKPKNASSMSQADKPAGTQNQPDVIGDPGSKLLIKTGNILYATLDSEVNTDDGGDVLGTIRSGEWDGSRIIGKIEQGPNNIRLRFSILSPQDNRKTMRISAIALREEDAKQGIAEDIDHHTLERYSSLAVASLMSGYGKAYSTPQGTTIITPGGTVATTTTEPTSRQINGMAVGEMGQAMSQEIRRGFNRPTTYSTPANTGFGLYFLQDVHEQ